VPQLVHLSLNAHAIDFSTLALSHFQRMHSNLLQGRQAGIWQPTSDGKRVTVHMQQCRSYCSWPAASRAVSGDWQNSTRPTSRVKRPRLLCAALVTFRKNLESGASCEIVFWISWIQYLTSAALFVANQIPGSI
jgi:hypothetical protein